MINFPQIKDFAIDLIFPNRCPFCDNFIKWDKLYCNSCYEKIKWVESENCILCGFIENDCICEDKRFYDKCFTMAYYNGIIKDAVLKAKSSTQINFSRMAAIKLVSKISESEYSNQIDIIIPVPMGRKKKKKIGFNHAEILCNEISKQLKVRTRTDYLYKLDSETAQHTMNKEERAVNVGKMFYINEKLRLDGKTVLICDDVTTTGATLNECARLVKSMGAENVLISAAAKTDKFK